MKKIISQHKKTLYHYTTLEAAVKILSTQTLRFGRFKNMNDISESKREYLSNISPELIDKECHNYQSLSLTVDSRNCKGFEIDSLWGYYADKGNGVCLAFNKEKLISAFKNQTSFHRYSPITYLPNFTSNVPLQVEKEENLHKDIIKNIKNIFFTKSKAVYGSNIPAISFMHKESAPMFLRRLASSTKASIVWTGLVV